jgi:hypothetical protein
MGDWRGGLILTAGWGAALGLVIWELTLTWDDAGVGGPGLAALIVGGGALVFGSLWPFFYHKPGSAAKTAGILDGVNIAIIPAVSPHASGIQAVRLSYTVQF